jgi:hypothetical protein
MPARPASRRTHDRHSSCPYCIYCAALAATRVPTPSDSRAPRPWRAGAGRWLGLAHHTGNTSPRGSSVRIREVGNKSAMTRARNGARVLSCRLCCGSSAHHLPPCVAPRQRRAPRCTGRDVPGEGVKRGMDRMPTTYAGNVARGGSRRDYHPLEAEERRLWPRSIIGDIRVATGWRRPRRRGRRRPVGCCTDCFRCASFRGDGARERRQMGRMPAFRRGGGGHVSAPMERETVWAFADRFD